MPDELTTALLGLILALIIDLERRVSRARGTTIKT
jgi:hypothetical protein